MRPFRLPARIGVFGEARITLQQALAMALANNKDITASRIDREIAGYNLTGARGLYDPTVGAVSQFLKQETPVASSLGGSATGAVLNRIWQTDPTVSGFTPWLGGTYHVDFSSQRVYTNNSFATLNPQYPSALSFPIHAAASAQPAIRPESPHHRRRQEKPVAFGRTIPPARDAGGAANRTGVLGSCSMPTTICKCSSIPSTSPAMQDESNRRQQEQGLLAPIDVVAAQTQLANFELNAYSAQTTLTQAENNLKTLDA